MGARATWTVGARASGLTASSVGRAWGVQPPGTAGPGWRAALPRLVSVGAALRVLYSRMLALSRPGAVSRRVYLLVGALYPFMLRLVSPLPCCFTCMHRAGRSYAHRRLGWATCASLMCSWPLWLVHAGAPDRNPSTLSFLSTTIALTGNFSSRTIYSRAAADAIKSAVVQRVTANGTVALPVGRVFVARLTARVSQGTTGRRLEVRGNACIGDPRGWGGG
jgi:hypothetical protein